MCKCNSESVDHLFLQCPVASELWDMVFGLFGVCWVMPMSVVGLFACWQGRFGCHRNGDIRKVVPLCLTWCIWKERNSRCFEDNERFMPNLKLLFFRTLLDWFSVRRNQPFSSILDLLDLKCSFLICSPLYTPCVLGCLSLFDINESLLLIKKKKKNLTYKNELLFCVILSVYYFGLKKKK